jgi:diguanylate cyclase (GGDEF)-like protein/PAS domain S-box-containing protein
VGFEAANPSEAEPGDTPPHGPALPPTRLDLQHQLQRLTLMCDSVPGQMAYYLRDGLVCRYANQPYAATFGLDAGSILGRALVDVIGAEALQLVQPHIDLMTSSRSTVRYTRCTTAADGRARWFDISLVPHGVADDGRALAGDVMAIANAAKWPLVGAFVLMTDITRFHDAEHALRDSEERLRKFMDASVEGIAFHREGLITDVNAPIAALLGLAREDMLGRHVMEFVAPEHRARAEQGRAHPSELPYESALLHRLGHALPVELFARELQRDGEPLRMVVARDIRDRQAARVRMQHLAEHDALTGLRNRGAFMAALGERIASHRNDSPALALLFIDLDHFKQVNDAHGHLAGDALLQGIAGRLLASLRGDAVAGRFGGDEFVILLPAAGGRAQARDTAQRLLAAMAEPVSWNGQLMSVTPTIGVALYPADAASGDALLRQADAALYAGKAAGRAMVSVFEPAMGAAAESARQHDARVADGLARGEFQLLLQPRLALPDGRPGAGGQLAGMQASLRWQHPDRGWLAGPEIAPAGPRRPQQPLVDFALLSALQITRHWQALGIALPLSLNLAGLVPRASGLVALLGRVLAREPVSPGTLALELPESLLVDDRHGLRRTVEQLAQLGLPVWLDDFGAGGAALADLRALPLAGLLLTPALVAGLPDDRGALAVVRGIVTLADGLGLPTCAPGVAGGAQVAALRSVGCAMLQGPWYQPPMPPPEASAWLASQATPTNRPVA